MLKIRLNKKKFRTDEAFANMLRLREHPSRKVGESLSDWADREVALACKGEDGYGRGCYQSALRAYKSLLSDDHSGYSWGCTRAILTRLMYNLPLKPIEDTPDVWCDQSDFWGESGHYQCSRMPSLFKEVADDGTVTYSDVDRAILVEEHDDGTESCWNSGWANDIVDEFYGPVTLPYYPTGKPYRIHVYQFDSEHDEPGCFDTVALSYITDPEGGRLDVNRYYHEFEGRGLVEISRDEYDAYLESNRTARLANKTSN